MKQGYSDSLVELNGDEKCVEKAKLRGGWWGVSADSTGNIHKAIRTTSTMAHAHDAYTPKHR
jgi:hypothetical protein